MTQVTAATSKEQLGRAVTKVNDSIGQLLMDISAAQKLLMSYKDPNDAERLGELKKLLGDLLRVVVQTTRNSPIVLDLYADSLKTASGWLNRRWNIFATEEARRSRFEEGKPADPTQNMDDADSQKWKEMHDKHKDNFKSATDTDLIGRILRGAYNEGMKSGSPSEGYDGRHQALVTLINEVKRFSESKSNPLGAAIGGIGEALWDLAFEVGIFHSKK